MTKNAFEGSWSPTGAVRRIAMIVTEIYSLSAGPACPIPFFLEPVEAGFPSPADDYVDCTIDLNEHLVKNPPATFMVRVRGNSMVDAGIQSGDLLIIDKSLDARDGDIVIAAVDGQFTVKRFRRTGATLRLMAANPKQPEIVIGTDTEVEIWGVVCHVIHSPRRSR
jgi:DNA polymerase V